MKKLITILTIGISISVFGQSTPEETFDLASKAVESDNAVLLASVIDSKEAFTDEQKIIAAKIILLIPDFAEFSSVNEEKIKANRKHVTYSYFSALGFFSRMPDFKTIKETGVFNAEKSSFDVPMSGRTVSFPMVKKDGKYKFWYPFFKMSDTFKTTLAMYGDYKVAIKQGSQEATQAELDKLPVKYIPSTSLQFKDQEMSGMIEGVPFNMESGKISQKSIFGEIKFALEFSSEPEPSNCKVNYSGNKVTFTILETGTIDFSQTGQNITLYLVENNNNIMVTDGKLEISLDQSKGIAFGKIVAQKDENNFINGNFEIKICGEIK